MSSSNNLEIKKHKKESFMEYKSRNFIRVFLVYENEWLVREIQIGDDTEWSLGI